MKEVGSNKTLLEDLIEYIDNQEVDEIKIIKGNESDEIELKKYIEKAGAQYANIYFIYTRINDKSEWTLRYIGKSKSGRVKDRLKNHFLGVGKDHGTKSRYNDVMKELEYGHQLGLKFICIDPDSLRNYFEEELIESFRGKCLWNYKPPANK